MRFYQVFQASMPAQGGRDQASWQNPYPSNGMW
jgi:hypothetical protein